MLIPSSRPSPYQVLFILGEAVLMALGVVLAVYLRLPDPTEIFTWKYSWHRIFLVPAVFRDNLLLFRSAQLQGGAAFYMDGDQNRPGHGGRHHGPGRDLLHHAAGFF